MIKHDKILNNLEKRIKNYGKYSKVLKNVEYKTSYSQGEVDLLAYDQKHDVWTMYEVKSSNYRSRVFKAFEQYRRFEAAFPQLRTKGVLVTPTRVMRL